MSDLTPLEEAYRQKLLSLFALVDPQKPEKGVRTLLKRARHRADAEGISYEQALADMYAGAEERTHRRVALLKACPTRRNEADT